MKRRTETRTRTRALALTAAALLTLAGCSQPLPEPEIDNDAQPTEQTLDPVTETVTETEQLETSSAANAAQQEADPNDYVLTDTAYAMSVAKSQCLIPGDAKEYEYFNCTVMLNRDLPALVGPTGGPGTSSANMIVYDPVLGFHTGHSEQAGQYGPAPELNPGQRISIGDFTVTRSGDNAYKVERGAHWFTIDNGEFAQGRPTLNLAETNLDDVDTVTTSTSAPEGSLCGFLEDEGVNYAVIAASPGTNCPAALETAKLYHSPDRPGELQGSAGFWDSPDGWHCGRGWLIPGREDSGANRRPVCSADGQGSVAIAETMFF